jgi:transcriptional regulator with XRE-family HTH domain
MSLPKPPAEIDYEKLYVAVDKKRRAKGIRWKQVAQETGVHPSSLSRLAYGKGLNAPAVLSLIGWLGVRGDSFLRVED